MFIILYYKLSNCPKYFPAIVMRMLNIATSSSGSDLRARRPEHLRSKHRSEAQVSAWRGASTAAQSANSHRQSSFERLLAASNELMLFLRAAARQTASILRIAVDVGGFFFRCWIQSDCFWGALRTLSRDGSSQELSRTAISWKWKKKNTLERLWASTSSLLIQRQIEEDRHLSANTKLLVWTDINTDE